MLKVSQRQLDPKLSTPFRPYHTHAIEQKLKPNEVVPIEVEIWATSMVFQKGSRIRVDVLPRRRAYFSAYHLKNNTVYWGGDRASYVHAADRPPRAGRCRPRRDNPEVRSPLRAALPSASMGFGYGSKGRIYPGKTSPLLRV